MTEQEGAACVLRLFGASSTAVGQAVENFPPRWEAAAWWKSRGAETLVALTARDPSGLKKAVRVLRERFPCRCLRHGADDPAGGGGGCAGGP